MQEHTEEITIKGKALNVKAAIISGKEIVVTGKFVTLGRIKEEWDVDVDNPALIIEQLKKSGLKVDLFTFIQRLPESKPMYSYPMEWDNVAALPITSYENWWKNQITQETRNKIRKSQKRGVEVRMLDFNDDLVQGISEIYNETPIRQGKPFWDYGKDIDKVKKENATFLQRADFAGAYFENQLIGYIKIVATNKYARTMGILSKVEHRDKSPTNLLIAKAVEICAKKKTPYLVYAKYKYGKVGSDSLKGFKRDNGFESIDLPRYYVPLTPWGKIVLKLNLHLGIVGLLPIRIIAIMLKLRKKWYSR